MREREGRGGEGGRLTSRMLDLSMPGLARPMAIGSRDRNANARVTCGKMQRWRSGTSWLAFQHSSSFWIDLFRSFYFVLASRMMIAEARHVSWFF